MLEVGDVGVTLEVGLVGYIVDCSPSQSQHYLFYTLRAAEMIQGFQATTKRSTG